MNRWIFAMAWRESRGNLGRLALFVACIVLGVAALVSITSFGDNLDRAIADQSKTLLGADLLVDSRMPFSEEAESLIDSIGGEQARETRFTTMAYFPATGGSRLAQVRALEGGFPFYGLLETVPADAAGSFQDRGEALVDDGLLIQYGAEVGDSIRIGMRSYRIGGRLKSIPGESAAAGLAGPRIFIPRRTVDATGLLQVGSQVTYAVWFRLPPGTDLAGLGEELKPKFERLRVDADTVEDRKRQLGRAFGNLTEFLNLVGFVALLLGGVGIASSIHVYIRNKLNTVAVLRCLGTSTGQAVAIYTVQAAGMGLVGAAMGAALGVGVQLLVPLVLNDFLPVDLEFGVSWAAIGLGMGIGVLITSLFAMGPLLRLRQVSPLSAIRQAFDTEVQLPADPWRWALAATIVLGVTASAWLLAGDLQVGLGYTAGIFAAFGLLALIGTGAVRAARSLFPTGAGFVARQGIANLFRPKNQTLVMVVTLGFGTFLIATLFLTRDVLLDQVEFTGRGGQPNLVFFDVQTDQREALRGTLAEYGLSPLQDVPIVTMRMAAINGEPLESLRESEARRIPGWLYERELRVSYRDTLNTGSETLTEGEWVGRFEDFGAVVPVSVEEGVYRQLELALGDTVTFDVQGVPVDTYIASVRQVNWQQVQPNFTFLFPAGLLDGAPQFHVMVLRTENREQSAAVQRAVVSRYANVSAIDLSLVLQIADDILGRVSFVIRFMALFSVFTGLIVLVGAVISSRYQRIQESVLLKTLGASRRQVLGILSVEYAALGVLAAATGLLLAMGAAWALARFVFEIPFAPAWAPMGILLVAVVGLTIGFGLLSSGDVYRRSALEVLREG